jgi:hypothetical protein
MGEAKAKKEAHVAALRQKAYELGLYGASVLSMPLADLAKHYNGCGPEFLPAAAREKLTDYLAIFEPAFLIHDLRFTFNDGSTADFNAANSELNFNLRRIAKATYSWYNWRRYRALAAADLITAACDRFGWASYITAGRVEEVRSDGVRSDGVASPTPSLTHSLTKSSLALFAFFAATILTGCYRSITVTRSNEYELVYRSVGLKTDVSKIEAEKMTNGTVRVLVEGVATDVSERNAKIIESSGTAVGNIAQKVVEGMK